MTLRVASLFSGAGGLDLGFLRAGFELAWANDHDPDAAATYAKNLGGHIVCGDIARIPARAIPAVDVVIGGFPCQGFSRANMLRSPDDKRNELYLEFLRVLRVKRPAYFVAENVRGLVSLDHGRVFSMILDDFASTGYAVDYRVFNLADFGVPQSRVRVFLVGTRLDIPADARPQWPTPTHSRGGLENRGLHPWVTIRDALRGITEPGGEHGLLNHVCSKYKVTDRNFTGHRRTDPNKPSPTILARGNGKGGVCALMHYRNHRRLSVRESARIQTFPDSFEFVGGLNSMYRQVGNAVPPLFAERLATEVRVAATTEVIG